MTEYVVNLTDVEKKALEYVAADCNEWIQNAIHERCRLAMEELVADTIRDKLARGETLAGTKEDIALASTLPNAKKRHDDMMASMMVPSPMQG